MGDYDWRKTPNLGNAGSRQVRLDLAWGNVHSLVPLSLWSKFSSCQVISDALRPQTLYSVSCLSCFLLKPRSQQIRAYDRACQNCGGQKPNQMLSCLHCFPAKCAPIDSGPQARLKGPVLLKLQQEDFGERGEFRHQGLAAQLPF